jgi:hypothetical protein
MDIKPNITTRSLRICVPMSLHWDAIPKITQSSTLRGQVNLHWIEAQNQWLPIKLDFSLQSNTLRGKVRFLCWKKFTFPPGVLVWGVKSSFTRSPKLELFIRSFVQKKFGIDVGWFRTTNFYWHQVFWPPLLAFTVPVSSVSVGLQIIDKIIFIIFLTALVRAINS